MKPLKLTIRGLRSYGAAEPVVIDFQGRNTVGVIGSTGAGKSSLLEAISLALFKQSSWSASEVANLIAHGSGSMAVELTFLHDGQRWTVHRAFYSSRRPSVHKLTCVETGEEVDSERKVNDRIEQLLGVNADTFHRVALLHQGRFDRLLVASKAERTPLLNQLLGIDELETAREVAGEQLKSLTDALTRGRVARAALPADPQSAADQAGRVSESAAQRAKRLGRAHTHLRELQDSRGALQTRRTAVSEASQAVNAFDTATDTTLLAKLDVIQQELSACEADLSERSRQLADDLAEAETGIEQLRVQGLSQQSIGRAGQTITQIPATVEQLRERKTEIEARVRQAAHDRAKLDDKAEALRELDARNLEAVGQATSTRSMANEAADRAQDVERALAELRHCGQTLADLRAKAAEAADTHTSLADEAEAADSLVLAEREAYDRAAAVLRDPQDFAKAEQSLHRLDDAVTDALSAGHTVSRTTAEAAVFDAQVEEVAEKIRRERQSGADSAVKADPLSKRIAVLEHVEEELDELTDELKEAVARCLETVGEQERRDHAVGEARTALLEAQHRFEAARDALGAARSGEAAALGAHEHLQHAAIATALARDLQPGEPCPVCAHELPASFAPPSPTAAAKIDRAVQAVKRAQRELAKCQTEHAAADARLTAAREAVTALETAAQGGGTQRADAIDDSVQLYAQAADHLTGIGYSPSQGPDALRQALEDSSPPPGATPRAWAHQLLEPLRRAQEMAEDELYARRDEAADLRAAAAASAKALILLATESDKAAKQAEGAARKVADAAAHADQAMATLKGVYNDACEAVNLLTVQAPADGFAALAEQVASAIAAAVRQPGRTVRPAKKPLGSLNALRVALDAADADEKSRQSAAHALHSALAGAEAKAAGKHEGAQRASAAAARLSEEADNAKSRNDEARAALVEAFVQATVALARAGSPLVDGPETLARAAAEAAAPLPSSANGTPDTESPSALTQAVTATARSAQKAERTAAELAAKLEEQRASLQSTADAIDEQDQRNRRDAQALKADERSHREAIAALPKRYLDMLPESTDLITTVAVEHIRRELDSDASKLQTLLDRRDTARDETGDVSRQLAEVATRRKVQIEHPLAETYERLAKQHEDIDTHFASTATAGRPTGPQPLTVVKRTVESVALYSTDLAGYRSRVLDLLSVAEDEMVGRLDELENRMEQAGAVLASIDGFEDAPDTRDPALLDRLTAAAAVAGQAAADAHAREVAALAQVPHAAALDRAIHAADRKAAVLEETRKLLRKDGFPAYLTMRRTQALLAVASGLFDTLSSGRFGFAADFRIVERTVGSVREARTLSGGEKFLASLALALAMVELYSRGGPRIDSLFLDEGFASLDEDSLDVALDVVRRQAGGARLVVLISHLRAVALAVDDVLSVERGAGGSMARWLTDEERDAILDDEIRAGLLNVA